MLNNFELAILNVLYKDLDEKELLTINYIEKFQVREIANVLKNNLNKIDSWDYILYYLIHNRFQNLEEAKYFICWNDYCIWNFDLTPDKCIIKIELEKDLNLYTNNYTKEDLKNFLLYNSYILPLKFELTIIEE